MVTTNDRDGRKKCASVYMKRRKLLFAIGYKKKTFCGSMLQNRKTLVIFNGFTFKGKNSQRKFTVQQNSKFVTQKMIDKQKIEAETN